MRRADRLFQIIQILRRRRITTASMLAEELEVSLRTVYRDIKDLILTGVPIEGEAGVGYALPKGFDLPPLMFTEAEIEALVLGARLVESHGDTALRLAARDVLVKVESVLPERLKEKVDKIPLFSLNFERNEADSETLGIVRQAVLSQHKVTFDYTRTDGETSHRTIRPLCLAFVAPHWMVTGWCELRNAFRNFRIDRIAEVCIENVRFEDEPGKRLQDFLKMVTRS